MHEIRKFRDGWLWLWRLMENLVVGVQKGVVVRRFGRSGEDSRRSRGGAAVEFSQEESGASAVQGQGYAQGGGEVPKEVRDTPETAEAPRE